ncbi:MAG: serine protease [Oscillatoria princeps RMCB-10]|jgi:tetratricopeptide (TPR) repeat protein|nr:serine protease [Oscillatoria princeps RMCB-10]
MRFYYGLPAALIGAAIVIVQPQVAAAFNTAEVEQIAKEITVLIPETLAGQAKGNGSGSILAREGNTYSVLTANHVVCADKPNEDLDPEGCQRPYELKVVTHDGKEYSIDNSTVKKLPGVDLAVFKFTSDKNYRVATLGNYDLTGEQFIFASGWPDPKLTGERKRERYFSVGKVIPKDMEPFLKIFPPDMGYDLLYTSITYGGMSGGPVLDTEGRVIGVHGQNEGKAVYEESSGKKIRVNIGFSVAIPISTFLNRTTPAGIMDGWLVETSPAKPMTPDQIGDLYVGLFYDLNTEKTTALSLANKGNMMWRAGWVEQAELAYNTALEINPKLEQAYYGKALVLTYWKRFPEALAAYEEVLKIDPSSNARQLRDKLKEYLDGTASQSQPPAATPATPLPESSAPATTPLPAQPPQPQPVPPPQQQPPAQQPLW